MRLALQATFDDLDGTTDESRRRRARCERELEQNRRSFAFYRKLSSVVDDPGVKAPEVFAQESFPDANVVAEYLDYRSESEEVASEYERVCWESPEALAEVGDCYDILVNDLPQPVVASKNCRRRLYYVAWEESAQADQNGTKRLATPQNDYVADDEFLPKATDVELENRKTSSASIKKDEKRKFKKDSNRTITTSKQESDVQRTMRKERSARRRLRGYALNAIMLLCALSFGVWALGKARDDRRSETFQLATEQTTETALRDANTTDSGDAFFSDEPTRARSNYFDEERRASADAGQDEVPLVADTRVGARGDFETDANSAFTPEQGTEPGAFDAFDDDVLAITHVDEETTDATIPGVSTSPNFAEPEQESFATSGVSESTNAQTSEQKHVRVGLRNGLNGARRRSVEIPAQNNDVFAPARRY